LSVPAIFWPGSGSTPVTSSLGTYMSDAQFQTDAPNVAKWIASRLGYPVMAVEMNDTQIYDCFETAILEYSSQVNEFNMRENMLNLQGASTGSSITQKLVRGSPLPMIIEIAEQYGTEAGVGGNVDWKRGYIDCNSRQQEYDLQALWGAVSESGNRIEIRRIFHERTPAISRGGFGFGDIGAGPTDGTNNLLGEFGWAGYDGGLNGFAGAATTGQFLVMPVYETLLRTQAIEFNDMIRRSQYSFELINNKIKLFPPPGDGERMYFQYLVKNDKTASDIGSGSVVSDYSNVPYTNIIYTQINDVGKQWIRKMALAEARGTLGRILSKYEGIPIPNADIRLDGRDLRQESEKEKQVLYDQLRESLEEAGRAAQMKKAAENEEHSQDILQKSPTLIYIG
jgi:hypothetical protein